MFYPEALQFIFMSKRLLPNSAKAQLPIALMNPLFEECIMLIHHPFFFPFMGTIIFHFEDVGMAEKKSQEGSKAGVTPYIFKSRRQRGTLALSFSKLLEMGGKRSHWLLRMMPQDEDRKGMTRDMQQYACLRLAKKLVQCILRMMFYWE